MNVRAFVFGLTLAAVASVALGACDDGAAAPDRVQSGQASYEAMCKGCHGGLGEGGTGPSLRDWSRGEPELTSIIDARMPLGNPDACRGDCAKNVAQYILAAFKGPVQCSGPHLSARSLRLLTVREYKNTLADLVGVSAQPPPPCGLHTFTFAQGSRFPNTPLYTPNYDMRSHQVSHYGQSSDPKYTSYVAQRTWFVAQFAYLIDQLKQRPEGQGTMLDNSILLMCSEVADGNTHSHDDMGFVLAGGTALHTGRVFDWGYRRHADLHLSIARAMGDGVGAFGDASSGVLPGLLV